MFMSVRYACTHTHARTHVQTTHDHTHAQTCRPDVSMELLLGVCHNGLRLVKLGLYDPNQASVFVCSLGIYVYAARSLCHEACG